MKKFFSGLVNLCLFALLVACTNENTSTDLESIQVNNPVNTATNTTLEVEDKEESDHSPQLDPIYSLLEEVMTTTISTESLSYYTSIDESTYFISMDDSANENYQDYRDDISGFLDTDNAYVDLDRYYAHTVPVSGSGSLDLIDSFDAHTLFYFNKQDGKYTNVITDNMWYKEALPTGFKTIDNLGDIVNIFLENSEYVVREEVTDSEDIDFGKTILSLEVPADIFAKNIINLTMNFFNGYYYPGEYEHPVNEDATRLKSYYAGLIINENKEISALYVSYKTSLDFGTEEDYYQFFTRTDFFDYNMTTVEAIPEEAYINAVEYES